MFRKNAMEMKATEDELKKRIIKRINSMSGANLKSIDEFIDGMGIDRQSKDITLSFSGKWKDMDEEIFQDLTENLQTRRLKGKERIYE
jgi:hypothetical protein